MRVGEKEVGFKMNVGVLCDYNDWCAGNEKASLFSAGLVKVEYMTRAYSAKNGGDFLTVAELRELEPWELDDILKAAREEEKRSSKRQVETAEEPKKKADK